MNTSSLDSATARYDFALRRSWKKHVPADRPCPQPSSAWPKENIALLEQYRDWLLSGGTGVSMVDQIYVPTAGYALGLNLTRHTEWDLEADFQRARDYLDARRLSAISTNIRRNALEKFRSYLRQQRGQQTVKLRSINHAHYCQGLPKWLVQQLERYQHLRQANWRAARLNEQAMNFWGKHTRLWRWLLERHAVTTVTDLKRQHLLDYADCLLTAGYAPRSINGEFRTFRVFLLFLQDQDYPIPRALLRVPVLKEPEPLPRFLTDEQVRRLRDDLEGRVARTQSPSQRRDALLDRAAFYLLWQGGLRLGEVEELRLEDLDLVGRKLMVRLGKGQKDRAVYLTDTMVRALGEYLPVRGQGAATDHVFLYRQRAVQKDLIRARIKASGERVGVAVTPHKLRHTCATQLLTAGCRITSIQKLLGHRDLNTTMIYAKAHDRNVSEDYYAAMARIETRLDTSTALSARLEAGVAEVDEPLSIQPSKCAALLALANRLAEPQLKREARLELVEQLRDVVNGQVLEALAV